jgi:beta-lactam-binding protein with PASTA domain
MRAMEKEPERRFADADEFIAALEAARAAPDEVIAPPPLTPLEQERRGRRWWLWLLILLALAAIAIGLYLTLRPEQLQVPDVVGLPEATAAQAVQNRGFEVEVEPRTNADVERGRVAAQDPRPNTMADEGSTVTLIVSTGPGQAPVPSVVGMPRDEAEDAVREAGFRPDVERVFSDDVDEGLVVEASPPEGTSAELGTTVTLRVSRGPEPVQVPDVVGEPEDDARSALEGAGLTVETNEQESEDQEPGTVLAQDPEGGAEVRRGSSVTITVAAEPEPVDIPDVIDRQADAAEAALDDAGFEVRVRERDVQDAAQDGVVIEQNPAGGEQRPEGTRVTIVVGRLVEPPTEPEPSPSPSPTPSPTVEPGG